MDEVTTTTAAAASAGRAGPVGLARIGLVGAAAAAIVAVGILVAGATASPTGTLAVGNGNGNAGAMTLPAAGFPDRDRMGPGFGRGPGFGGITISAVSGSNLALTTGDGWTRTITVDSGTTYTKSGASITLSDLKVGDQIGFRQTREDDGTFTIDGIVVILPHAGGEVTAISGSTITVKHRDDTTATIKATSATDYMVGGDESASLSDVKVGMHLVAEGTRNADGSLTATRVRAVDPDDMPGPGGFRGQRHGAFGGGAAPWSAPDADAGSAG